MEHNTLLLLALGSFLPNNLAAWVYRWVRRKITGHQRQPKPSVIALICEDLTNIMGHEVTFLIVVIALIGVYGALIIQGYTKWNTGIGLFSNTNGSNLELITGVGSMYLLRETRKLRKSHKQDNDALHAKLDVLIESKVTDEVDT